MKPLLSLLAFGFVGHAAETNFFISPGSQADLLASGNHTEDYPVYRQGSDTLISWKTNWTTISLLLYQNENPEYIRLLDFEEDSPSMYTYNMSPDVNLTWNDVFFFTLWNENRGEEGGQSFFSSSYFRINASDPDQYSTTSTSTSTTSTSTPTSTSTTETPTSSPQPTDPSSLEEDSTTSTSDSNSGLTTPAKTGLGIGIGLGIPALALAAVAAFYFRRRAQAAAWQQQQPGYGSGSGQFPPPLGPYGPISGLGGGGGGGGGAYPGSSPPVSDASNPSPFKLGLARLNLGLV
ncbi:hypothetical protein BJX61DRAFT_537668 [Aspergillus egyptiacus]|nr:hypothetical protein BJX61DRAFT_537668 [Aspergillus egyptiacus]